MPNYGLLYLLWPLRIKLLKHQTKGRNWFLLGLPEALINTFLFISAALSWRRGYDSMAWKRLASNKEIRSASGDGVCVCLDKKIHLKLKTRRQFLTTMTSLSALVSSKWSKKCMPIFNKTKASETSQEVLHYIKLSWKSLCTWSCLPRTWI